MCVPTVGIIDASRRSMASEHPDFPFHAIAETELVCSGRPPSEPVLVARTHSLPASRLGIAEGGPWNNGSLVPFRHSADAPRTCRRPMKRWVVIALMMGLGVGTTAIL